MGLFAERFKAYLNEVGILPVVSLKDEKELKTFVNAILNTEIRCVEITLRNPFAPDAIRYIKENYKEIIVGAGTVSNKEKLKLAIKCGVDFCVAPGTMVSLLEEASAKNIPFLPGCSTPSEIMMLSEMGYEIVKLFPAECSGGVDVLKLYAGAFAEMKFLPTGGITQDNFVKYTSLKNVVACGGSFMVPKDMLASGNSDGISQIVNSCVMAIKEGRG